MSPFLGKIALVLCAVSFIGSLLLILYNIHSLKEDWEWQNDDAESHGIVRQHGDYWVWHDYIRRHDNVKDNESITLTTHGTFMDLGMMPTLLERWQAPISLSIFASGSDFVMTIRSLRHLIGCQKQGNLIHHFVSIHLVFHSQHIPKNMARFKISPYVCAKHAPFEKMRHDLTYWHKTGLIYPVNLMRNVARYNSETFYIMALDLQLLPPPNFVKSFLSFVRSTTEVQEPFRSVYCLPTFPHKPHAPIAQSKVQLKEILQEYNISSPIYNNIEMQNQWLASKNSLNVFTIFHSSTKMNMCVGYVSINELEPLYDERCDMESIYDGGFILKGKVLMDLKYTFLILNEAFLIRHAFDSWRSIKLAKFTRKSTLKMSLNWHKFYNNFVNLEPQGNL
ncbi:beta-1,4-glucuronyltransferase 1-like [Drosophila albomicans]|uniref:Beta-1,4-glucuronyltransferase 1-like n=1 Tax=Drosophila albomicans TaxID=7291 RepID=A0A6P8WI20_DROAB|nr:beta-1,4-glucuronyltransferase 1-like [Drosophila albomicans]